MRGMCWLWSLLVLLAVPMMAMATPQKEKNIAGIWQGALDVSGQKLRLIVKVSRDAAGVYTGTLDSVDQGAKDIKLDSVALKGDTVLLELKSIGGSYEGKLSADGKQIEGEWKQSGGVLLLTLKRDDKLPEMRRPQEPKKPYPYLEEEVSYDNAAAGNKLAGTLTLPKTGGPFPVALLITGSGPQDRNEELLGHKPFLVLADHLTRQGIAVLRVDDRGIGKSTGDFGKATSADFATDVLAGIAYLKTRKEINPAQIGLIGHSEGGLIAPMVAAQSKDVAFIVLLAGPGVNGAEILKEQSALILAAQGVPKAQVDAARANQEKLYAILLKEKDDTKARKEVGVLVAEQLSKLPEEQRKAASGQANVEIAQMFAPWMRYFLSYEPTTSLRKVTCPVLALNGAKDLQVPPKQNLPVLEKVLKDAGNTDVTIKELPNLNHLLQTSTTGSPTEYSQIEETMAPVALKTVSDWIRKRTIEKK